MHEIEKLAQSKYWRAEQAEVVVEAWRLSDEPATVFGRRWGISPERIRRWAKQLAPMGHRARVPLGLGSERAFAFHRLELETSLASSGTPGPRGGPGSTSVVADVQVGRWTVAVRSGFDAEELEQVLEMVAEL